MAISRPSRIATALAGARPFACVLPALLAGAACSGGETRSQPPPPSPTAVATAAPRPTPAGVVGAPRLVAPITGASTYTDRPSFTVELAEGSEGATLELCADRDCGQVLQRVAVAPEAGSRLARGVPEVALAAGRVFWRARPRLAGGGQAGGEVSATWQLAIPRVTPGVDTLAITFHDPPLGDVLKRAELPAGAAGWAAGDVDGDGHSDAVILACPPGVPCATPGVTLLSGRTARATASVPWPEGTPSPASLMVLGDVDRDGYSDVAITADNGNRTWLFRGSAAGLVAPTPVTATVTLAARADQGCDINGDGFMDYVAVRSAPHHTAAVHLGSAAGLSKDPSFVLESGEHEYAGFGEALGFGDVNRDGFCDVVAGAYRGGPRGRGRIHVFHGGRSPSTSPAQILDEPDAEKKSKARPHFGITIAVRDTDADGAADVYAATACYLDDQEKGLCNDGTVYEYRGEPSGLVTGRAKKLDGLVDQPDRLLEQLP